MSTSSGGSGRARRPYWTLNVYPDAGEAGGCLIVPRRAGRVPGEDEPVFEPVDLIDHGEGVMEASAFLLGEVVASRSDVEAARRAKGKIRRYCAANRLNRFITLTYRPPGCHDQGAFRTDLAAFFKVLRRELGGRDLPYLWVPEWHPRGHGLHGHAAVGRYISRSVLTRAWPHGFVHIKLIGDLPVGSGAWEEARRCGRYLGKYASKAIDERRPAGLHRYEVAQGFQPRAIKCDGRTVDQVIQQATQLMGRPPARVWKSTEQEGWDGPPCCSLSW